MAAVTTTPTSLKFALRGLNQDRDCLIAAKLWDGDYDHPQTSSRNLQQCSNDKKKVNGSEKMMMRKKRIVLSTRFSLGEESSPTATNFTVLFKSHPYIKSNGEFVVHSPNAFSKGTCDPEWTRLEWPCRGTRETCRMVVVSEHSPSSRIPHWDYFCGSDLGLLNDNDDGRRQQQAHWKAHRRGL